MFKHGENGLTILIDYSPINQLFHKLGHLLTSPSNLSAPIRVQQFSYKVAKFKNQDLTFGMTLFSKLHNYFGNDLVKKNCP